MDDSAWMALENCTTLVELRSSSKRNMSMFLLFMLEEWLHVAFPGDCIQDNILVPDSLVESRHVYVWLAFYVVWVVHDAWRSWIHRSWTWRHRGCVEGFGRLCSAIETLLSQWVCFIFYAFCFSVRESCFASDLLQYTMCIVIKPSWPLLFGTFPDERC